MEKMINSPQMKSMLEMLFLLVMKIQINGTKNWHITFSRVSVSIKFVTVGQAGVAGQRSKERVLPFKRYQASTP